MRLAVLVAVTCVAGMVARPAAAEFATCVETLKRAAIGAGVSPLVASRALDGAKLNEDVLRFSRTQPEFKKTIWDYLAVAVDDRRIRDGRAKMRDHALVLRDVERRFGVDRHIVVAIWGLETDYGQVMGSHFLPHSLGTLACASGRRADFWRGELIAALKLVDGGDLSLTSLHGSWAGAFGQTQFIPSSYARLAIDFDGDGRRDLVNSVADALGSTGNYLKRAGWRADRPAMIEVKVPPNYDGPAMRTRKVPLSTWAARGFRRADGKALDGPLEAGLLLPAGPTGPGLLVTSNFDAILAYNQAESYAIAVSYLAHRLAGGAPFRTPWPTEDAGLSRDERLRLQHLLLGRGFDVGEPDGLIGPKSRAAIAAAEKQFGLPETGRPSRKIYETLGGH